MKKLKIKYFIGLMGSGKTYWVEHLSKKLHIHFADLDNVIEEKLGYKISEIFKKKGELYFRQKEADLLREQAKFGKIIISTGGGTPCYFNNMQWMNNSGKTIWLDETLDNIYNRLIHEKSKRPLISNLSDEELKIFIQKMYNERLPYFELSSIHLKNDEINENNIEGLIKNF